MADSHMKILMTADSVGGVWTYAVDLCRALGKLDIEVHLAVFGGYLNQGQKEQAESCQNIKCYESSFKLEWMEDPWEDIQKSRDWFASIYEEAKPDIIHFNNYALAGPQWNCPVITVFHSCVLTWWKAVKKENAPESFNRYKTLVKNALGLSDIAIFPSKAMAEAAEDQYGEIANFKIIYNGSSPIPDQRNQKESFILCVGRLWDEAKNITLLAQIAPHISWPIYIAGSTEEPGSDTKVSFDGCHLLGNLPAGELRQVMQKAGIYIHPARYEPFGLAVLEAANAGCPLVLSGIRSLQEIWGGNALYFDSGNPQAAVEICNSLIADEIYRRQMSEKAVLKAKEYTAGKMAKKMASIYQDLKAKSDAN
ncbi:MAG TPA: glycosyltransferase family 4 protein, partial [Flavobacterium sp.]|nr:glycosyltransferase family 4 protein [Flavobacterium sp.]